MRITLEPTAGKETEVILRGDPGSREVGELLELLRGRGSGRLLLYQQEEQWILDAEEIVFLEVREGKVFAYTSRERYEARSKLYEIKALLACRRFAQINKSTLVNMAFVQSIQAEFSGNYRVKLKNRGEVLTLSRKYFPEFKKSI